MQRLSSLLGLRPAYDYYSPGYFAVLGQCAYDDTAPGYRHSVAPHARPVYQDAC